MGILTKIIEFVIYQILDQAQVFIGLIALAGLALQRKTFREILEGTLKTIVGMYAFSAGAGVLVNAILPINDIMKPTLAATGTYPFNEPAFGVAMTHVAQTTVLTFIVGWVLHMALVWLFRKTFKAVYLTGHIMLFFAALNNLFWQYTMGLSGAALIITSAIVCALYWTVAPTVLYKYSRKFVGDDFTLGHHNYVGALIGVWLGPKIGDPVKEDADKLNLPGWLSIFSDVTLNLAITMPIFFLVVGLIARAVGNPAAMDALAKSTGTQNWIVWLILQGVSFSAGVAACCSACAWSWLERPAFKASREGVPGAVPALTALSSIPIADGTALASWHAIEAVLVTIVLLIVRSPLIVIPAWCLPLRWRVRGRLWQQVGGGRRR